MTKNRTLCALLALMLVLPLFNLTALAEEEKPTLRVLGFNAAFDPNEDINAKEIEKVTGYKVEYSMLPAENADEKLNIELASGTRYDIIKLNSTQYFQLVGRGALMGLDGLLQDYGQNILSAVGETSWKACEYNGNVYAVPMRKEYTKDVMNMIVVRKDLLDAINVEIPKTLDEFYEALKAIKAAYPDKIPLTGPMSDLGSGAVEWVLSPTISSAFGIYTEWQDVNGELIPMLKNQKMKDQLEFMSKLYQEGLLDADWAVNTGTLVQEKFSSGNAVMAVTDRNIVNIIKGATLENDPDAVIDYVLPLIGPDGEQGAKSEDKIIYYSCIPKNAEHPEDAMKFMNAKSEWDNFVYLTLGTEGVHFTRNEKADAPSGYEWIPIMPIFSDERTNSYWYLNNIDETNYPDMWMARVRKSESMWEPFEKVSLACADISKADPLGYMPPSEYSSKYSQSLTKMANDFYLKVITGAENLDAYDKFVSEWDGSGGTEMSQEVNTWYKSFYSEG